MSYRNPGDIRIADPGAFMKAFEAKVQPVIEELKKKKEERKKEAKKYDSDVAKFNESMNYPQWAKTLNAEAAASLKSIINKNYIDNGRFRDASESERQEILDEINIGIGQSLNKVNNAIQLSYNEILPGDFEDNPEFLSFIKNVPATSQLNISEVDGQPAFSYTIDGETKTLRADQIPDGVGDYKGRSAINEKYTSLLAEGVKSIDEKLKKREELGLYEASQDGQKTAMGIFSQLDQRERNYIFEEAQIDINGDEEGGVIAYGDIEADEPRKAADEVIIESIKKKIEDESIEIGRIKSDEIVRRRKAQEEDLKSRGQQPSTKQEVSNFIVQFNTMVNKGSKNAFIDFAQRTIPGVMKMPNGNYTIPSADPEERAEVLTEDQLIATLADFYSKNPAAFANAKNSVMNIDTASNEATPETSTTEGASTSTDWNQFKVN